MKKNSVLMVFEELWPILLKIPLDFPVWRNLKIPMGCFSVWDGASDPSVLEEWAQKHQRTWWQVDGFLGLASSDSSALQECRYLADSFADAVRLRPDLPVSYHSLQNLSAPDLELFWDLEEAGRYRREPTVGSSACSSIL